jgi:hypothetical protein
MPLEIGTTIADLDQSWPLGGDPTNQGDDHLRLLKAVLKSQFPGEALNGYAIPIIANEAELNSLDGLDVTTWPVLEDRLVDIETKISNLEGELSAPQGTKMLFPQATAPNGWTQDTSENDRMLRIVSGGTGGSVGGTDSPILMDKVPSHTHGAGSLVTGNMSANATHSHNVNLFMAQSCACSTGCYGGYPQNSCNPNCGTYNNFGNTDSASVQHTHAISGSTAANGSAANWTPKYTDVIVCSKD